jgi:CheY-like chemotaxis protein
VTEAASPTLSRVLYVDDDPTLTLLTRMSLERVGGFTVQTCTSGAEAVTQAPQFMPDLILLDVMMPDMDGPATLKALRQNAALADIPIVFLTAKVQPDEVERYRGLGAVATIAKPFDPVALPGIMRDIWQRSRA